MRRTWRHTLCLTALAVALGCRGQAVTGEDPAAPAGTPDQIATGTSLAINDPNGLRQALVTADSAFVFQQSQRIEFRTAKVIIFDQRGDQAATLTAGRAIYDIRTGLIEADRNAAVTTDRQGRLTAPKLTFDPRRLQFRNDGDYRYDPPGGAAAVVGRRVVADVRLNSVKGARN